MENKENIAGLGKNHDSKAHDHDLAKKQSEAQPAAENLEMQPNSVNGKGQQDFNPTPTSEGADQTAIHKKASEYAKQEHEKADNWEDTSKKP